MTASVGIAVDWLGSDCRIEMPSRTDSVWVTIISVSNGERLTGDSNDSFRTTK